MAVDALRIHGTGRSKRQTVVTAKAQMAMTMAVILVGVLVGTPQVGRTAVAVPVRSHGTPRVGKTIPTVKAETTQVGRTAVAVPVGSHNRTGNKVSTPCRLNPVNHKFKLLVVQWCKVLMAVVQDRSCSRGANPARNSPNRTWSLRLIFLGWSGGNPIAKMAQC